MILVIYNLLMFYIGYNIHIFLDSSFDFSHPFVIGFVVFFLSHCYFFGRFVHLSVPFKIIGSYWLVFVQYAGITFPFLNLFVFFTNDKMILYSGIVFIFFILFIFIKGTFNAYNTVVRKFEIKVSKESLRDSLRIVMASDMHFGTLSGKRHASRLVETINKQNPELVMFAGDIVDDDPKPFIEKNMGEMIEKINSPLGVFAVLGNHDYYGKEVPLLLSEMKKRNVHMLLDETVTVDDFYIIGRKDYSDKTRLHLEELTKSLDKEKLMILIDHQPHELELSKNLGIDISLSGHTHRGQMSPNHLITKKVFELDYGYKLKDKMHAFVSSGFGFWGAAVRIGSRSEIFIIDVTFTKK